MEGNGRDGEACSDRTSGRLKHYRTHTETFKGVRWHRANRLWHEKHKRVDPRFSAACKIDWRFILKRPDTRFGDARQIALAARDLGVFRQVYFVVYIKRDGFVHVISVRYATDDDEHQFLASYP